jgi:hypothetical protein
LGIKLTYNATSPKIRRARECGLKFHDSIQRQHDPKRAILVTPDVDKVLLGYDLSYGLPPLLVAQVVGRFLAGHVLSVSRKKAKRHRRKTKVDLEQLEGLSETWGLCFRRPRPGWRVFGRFLERDVLIVLRVYHREDIGSDYARVAAEIAMEWTSRLGDLDWVESENLADYISGTPYNVDEEED